MTSIRFIAPKIEPPPERSRAYHRWSVEEVAELIRHLADGGTTQEIAQAHGRSEGAIRSRITHLYNEGQIEIIRSDDEEEANDEDEEEFSSPDRSILIIGAGGIGGLLTHHVARAAAFSGLTEQIGILRLTLMDGDVVEERNLPHQQFDWHDIGLGKASVTHISLNWAGVTHKCGVQIVAIAEDFTAETDLSEYDLVVVAVDREEPRRLVHEHAKRWLDLRARGDGFVMCSHETDPRVLATIPTLPDDESASCQLEDAVETGNIQFGFALAASHGAQWIVQWLRGSDVPSSRMYTIHMGELPFPTLPEEVIE